MKQDGGGWIRAGFGRNRVGRAAGRAKRWRREKGRAMERRSGAISVVSLQIAEPDEW